MTDFPAPHNWGNHVGGASGGREDLPVAFSSFSAKSDAASHALVTIGRKTGIVLTRLTQLG